MQDNHVIPFQETSKGEGRLKTWQKVLIGAGIFIFLLATIFVSFYLGTRQSQNKNEVSPTPTQVLTQIPTLTAIPTSTQSATPTKKISITPTPSPTSTPTVKSLILDSISSLDGFRSSNGGGNNTLEIRAGRNQDLVTRGFVSFDLSDLPNSANIQSATLRLYQSKVEGNPYSVAGALKIDHLNYGESLDSSDYAAPALISNLTTISGNSAIGWKEANVTTTVNDDIANARSRSQYRIHFVQETTGGDTSGDFAYFDSANSYVENTNHPPQLIVKYN